MDASERCELHSIGDINRAEQQVSELDETDRTKEKFRMMRIHGAPSQTHVASYASLKRPIRSR
jgi:hypothetical protein